MSLPIRRQISATERAGVNFVRGIVEAQNSIFHEIHHENDYGNDAFVELVDGEEVTGTCVGVQIKSGQSYCTGEVCRIPYTEKQGTYWKDHSLGVLGIVYDPAEQRAYWVDLAAQCRRASGPGSVTFEKSQFRRFDADNFASLIVPLLLRRRPHLPMDRATLYAEAAELEAHSIGLRALLYGHHDDRETWRTFHRMLVERPVERIDPFLAYALGHIPWHGDVAWSGPPIDGAVRAAVREEMKQWIRRELLPLLGLMNENGVERGSPGQSVYAVIDMCVADAATKLADIAFDDGVHGETREKALYLCAFVLQEDAIPILQKAVEDTTLAALAGRLLDHLKASGFFGV